MARHILVVDDDGDVRDVIIAMLLENDFIATAASGGIVPIDAIVLDSLMPGEASGALASHANELRIPVVMISGSFERMKSAENNGLQLLLKPFRMETLIQAVESAIASGQFGQRGA
jgi:DNA-binding NtrC family response regulator